LERDVVKTRVRVTLVAEEEVEIEVEHEEGNSPTDLTDADVERACCEASAFADWSVDDVREVAPSRFRPVSGAALIGGVGQQASPAECEGEPDCGWHAGGSCAACRANAARGMSATHGKVTG
jgi:hypothetical protein